MVLWWLAQPAHVVGAVPPAPPPPVRPRVALEKKDAISRGDVLAVDPTPLLPGSQVSGERALVPVGNDLFSPQEGQRGRGWVLQARGLEGFRSHVRQGLRRREYNSSVALLDDSPPQGGGLQLQGPRPSMNTGFELRRFPEVTGLFIRARRCMRRILESMLTIDRMNVPALQSAELLIRRMMVIREAHKYPLLRPTILLLIS